MRRFAAKLGFVHRELWQRRHAYRWAVLLGPPPLIGCAVAALVWAGDQRFLAHAPSGTTANDVPWAQWTRPVMEAGQPFTEVPSAPLPRSNGTNRIGGLQPGWVGGILPMTIDAVMGVNIVGTSLGSFTLDQPTIPLKRITDAGPPTGLFVGATRAFFVARTRGVYAFSARLTRDGTQSADCIVRLNSAHHRILRNEVLHAAGDAVLDFQPIAFRLDPGLFALQLAVGCWRGDVTAGSGELTLMVRHPGDEALRPAGVTEVMRPAPRGESGVNPGASPGR